MNGAYRRVPGRRVGRDLATRVYALRVADWPRVQAYRKVIDRDDAGWDRVPVPDALEAEVAGILRDAEARHARARRRAA